MATIRPFNALRPAAEHAVEVAAVQDGIAVVAKGLSPGEQVVVDGQYRLTNGARIKRSAPQTG